MNEDSTGRPRKVRRTKDSIAAQRRTIRGRQRRMGREERAVDAGASQAGHAGVRRPPARTARNPAESPPDPRQLPLWKPRPDLPATDNALHHWRKHAPDLPEIPNALHYVRTLHALARGGATRFLTKVRANGDRLYYDPLRNLLAVLAYDGQPRTLFRPQGGIDYWNGL